MPQGYFQFEVANRLAIFGPNLVDARKSSSTVVPLMSKGKCSAVNGVLSSTWYRFLISLDGWVRRCASEPSLVRMTRPRSRRRVFRRKKADGFVLPLQKIENQPLGIFVLVRAGESFGFVDH